MELGRIMAGNKKLDVEAVERALDKAKAEVKAKADEPDHIGNRAAFILWQHLGGVDMPDGTAVAEFKPHVKRFFGICPGLLFDEYGEPLGFTEFWGQFVEVCNKVKFFRRDCLELAKQRAVHRTEPLPELVEYDQAHQKLGAVCYELQQITEDSPFFLSSYDAGEIMGKKQKVGWRALKMFVFDGILKLHRAGDRHNASEYFYIGEQSEQAKTGRRLTESEFEQRKRRQIEALREADKQGKKQA